MRDHHSKKEVDMKYILIVIGLILPALVLIIIIIKTQNTIGVLQNTTKQQEATIKELSNNLEISSDSLTNSVLKLASLADNLDNLSNEYKNSAASVIRLSSKLRTLSASFDSLRIDSGRKCSLLEAEFTSIQDSFADSNRVLEELRSLNSALNLNLDGCHELISHTIPWYLKWKHDATERSFVEVLFGADKGKKPDITEPNFQNHSTKSDSL
jgi:hypothetical protein